MAKITSVASPVTLLSIGQAHEEVQSTRDVSQIRIIGEAVIQDDALTGGSDDYHNLSVEFSKRDDYSTAFLIVKKGLKQYPYNIDLLSDAIYYGSKCGKYAECDQYASTLQSRPYGLWNWRAFTFLIDYYVDKTDWLETDEKILNSLTQAVNLAQKYQEILPTQEKGYLAEYKVRKIREQMAKCQMHDSLEKPEKKEAASTVASKECNLAEDALKRALESNEFSAVQCCLKYADIKFEAQDYQETIKICERALTFAESQPSARISYFMYLSALSKDALIHQEGVFGDAARVSDAFSDYAAAYSTVVSKTYQNNIKTRVRILSAKSGIPCPVLRDQEDELLSRLSSRLKAQQEEAD